MRCCQRPPSRAGWLGRQLCRTLQERRGCRQPAARLRPVGRALQRGREILIGPAGSLRAVPRRAIRVCLGIGRLSQRAVGRLPVGQRRSAIDRRAHERVLKPDMRSELDQADRLRRRGRFDPSPTSSADRISNAGSPTGSAAARSRKRCVCSGIDRTRPRKLPSRRAESGCIELTPKPPASSATDSSRGSSSNARGLPRASATIRSTTSSSTPPTIAKPSTRARLRHSGPPR